MHSPDYLPSWRVLAYAKQRVIERLIPSFTLTELDPSVSVIHIYDSKFDPVALVPELSIVRLIRSRHKTYNVHWIYSDTKLNLEDKEMSELRANLDQEIDLLSEIRASDGPNMQRHIWVADAFSCIRDGEPWYRIQIRFTDAIPFDPSS